MSETAEEVPIATGSVAVAKCPACGAEMDVEGIPPFTPVQCPACGADFEIPAQFGQFRLLKMLGHGGMGGVFLGRDEMLDRQVAIKVMLKSLGDDPEFTARFQREAQAAAKLNHPNIAQIYSFGTEKGQPYIAMELVPNGSLDKKMEKEPGGLDPAWTMRVGLQIAQGLSNAAASSLVHGDVKPENILFDADGNAKLVDFGLAAMQGDSSEIWGTPYYISPEKVKRQKIDFKADIYSLGGTLYHALTGQPPFDGEDATAVVKARIGGVPRPPSEVRPGLPEEIDKIIMRMLEEDPARRYPTYDSLIGDINRYLPSAAKTAHPGLAGGKKLVLKGASRRAPVGLAPRMGAAAQPGDDAFAPEGLAPLAEPPKPGMSLGKKAAIVAASILGGLVLFGGIMTWALWPKDNTQETLENARISVDKNRTVVAAERERAADELGKAEEKVAETEKLYKECIAAAVKFSPADAKFLTFPETKELLRLRSESGSAAGGERAAAASAQAKPAAKPAKPARPPVEIDLKDPDVQDRLAKEAKEKAAKEGKEGAGQAEAPAQDAAAPAQEAAEPSTEMRDIVDRVRQAWTARCAMHVAMIELRNKHAKLKEALDAFEEVSAGGVSEAMATRTGEAAVKVQEMAAAVVAKDVFTAAAKVSGAAKTINVSIEDKAERRRYMKKIDDDKRKYDEETAKRREREAKEKEELRQREIAAAAAKYDEIKGLLESLSWKQAADQLERAKRDFKTPEGAAALDIEIRRVAYMRGLHEWLVKSSRGTALRPPNQTTESRLKSLMRKWRQGQAGEYFVHASDPENIVVRFRFRNARGETVVEDMPGKISWLRVYKPQSPDRDYKGWLNQLLHYRVVQVRAEEIDGKENPYRFALSPKEQASNLIGAALTYRMFFADNQSAQKLAGEFLKSAVKEFPECEPDVKALFPGEAPGGDAEAPAQPAAAPAAPAAASDDDGF